MNLVNNGDARNPDDAGAGLDRTPVNTGPMHNNALRTLAELIERDHDELLTRWGWQVRQLASVKHLDTPALNDHVPVLLVKLAAALNTMYSRAAGLSGFVQRLRPISYAQMIPSPAR